MSKILKFPEGFLWGAATSAHQVEGNNNNDWTEWEKKNALRLAKEAEVRFRAEVSHLSGYSGKIILPPEAFRTENYISGDTCDHYNRFREDFDIAKSLSHNAYRFSIEWSRIEPEEGKFNEKEIEHYREVIKALRERGLEPFVTLWHWTLPLWVRDFGGVESRRFISSFSRYVRRIAKEYEKDVKFWVTLNEPTSVIANGYRNGVWPPQKKGNRGIFRAFSVLAGAHREAYCVLHEVNPTFQVSFGNILFYNEPHRKSSLIDYLTAFFRDFWTNHYFNLLTMGMYDYIALQYYFHSSVQFPNHIKNENKMVSDMYWEIYPKGLYQLLVWLGRKKKPIYITENGIADAKDEKRAEFIKNHLYWIHKAISEGVDVRGYFYWSLLDNFEWDKGFWPRFGLIEIDYKTLERKPRPSSYVYAEIAKSNAIEIND